jgi:predicted Zn finger-like uncharacterized protein
MPPAKVACPSCGSGLRVGDGVPAGKKVRCPKCQTGFAVPARGGRAPASQAVTARPGKSAAPPEDEEELDEEPRERPAPRKPRKKARQEPGNGLLIAGLALGVLMILCGGAAIAMLLWPADKKTQAVAQNSPAPQTPSAPAAETPGRETAPAPETVPAAAAPQPGAGRGPAPPARPGPARPGAGSFGPGPAAQPAAPPPPAGGASQDFAVGQRVFQNNCARCHGIGGGGGGGPGGRQGMGGGRRRGPDLSTVGRNPTHTATWLAEYIRDPRSINPDSSMPRFAGKINEEELKALAEYLASLK